MDDDRALPDATPDRDYDTLGQTPPDFDPEHRPRVPSTLPPMGACDCHLHLVGGRGDFPSVTERARDPALSLGFNDWLDRLRTHLATLEISRAVIVQSVLHGDDNSVTIEALRQLGDRARGVALVRDTVSDEVLDRLVEARIRAVRLNETHQGPLSWEGARALAPRLADRDMHLEFLPRPGTLADRAEAVADLPCRVVLDHLGAPDLSAGPDDPTAAAVERLVGDGQAHVKIAAVYRRADAPWDAVDPLIGRLAATPERCLWGSDWPYLLRQEGTARPDAGDLIDAFFRAVTDPARRQTILVDTPERLYGF